MAAADAIEGAPATVELLADEVRALERATDDVRALASSAALPADVVTTLEAAAAAGDELAALGERAGTGIELQLELGGRVEDLVARWDDDASRSQQLERLGEVEDELREIADADAVAPSDCDDGVSTWLAVAERAAEITAELLVHVGGYDGTSFDATRADGRVEVAQLAPGAPSPSSCAALDGMRAAAAALDVALVDVEDALNPPELVTDG